MSFADLINQHSTVVALGGYWLFSILVTSMPPPKKDDDAYAYLYNVLHGISGVLTAKLGQKFPEVTAISQTVETPGKTVTTTAATQETPTK